MQDPVQLADWVADILIQENGLDPLHPFGNEGFTKFLAGLSTKLVNEKLLHREWPLQMMLDDTTSHVTDQDARDEVGTLLIQIGNLLPAMYEAWLRARGSGTVTRRLLGALEHAVLFTPLPERLTERELGRHRERGYFVHFIDKRGWAGRQIPMLRAFCGPVRCPLARAQLSSTVPPGFRLCPGCLSEVEALGPTALDHGRFGAGIRELLRGMPAPLSFQGQVIRVSDPFETWRSEVGEHHVIAELEDEHLVNIARMLLWGRAGWDHSIDALEGLRRLARASGIVLEVVRRSLTGSVVADPRRASETVESHVARQNAFLALCDRVVAQFGDAPGLLTTAIPGEESRREPTRAQLEAAIEFLRAFSQNLEVSAGERLDEAGRLLDMVRGEGESDQTFRNRAQAAIRPIQTDQLYELMARVGIW